MRTWELALYGYTPPQNPVPRVCDRRDRLSVAGEADHSLQWF